MGKHGDNGNISAEDLIAANPDAIFMVWYNGYTVNDTDYAGEQVVELITENPAFASLDAVKNDRVFAINLNNVYCSGMRTLDGVLDFAESLPRAVSVIHGAPAHSRRARRLRRCIHGFENGVFRGRWQILACHSGSAGRSAPFPAGISTFGSVDLKMGDVYRVILCKVTEALHFPVGDPDVYGSGSMSDIVWFVRLPRLVLAIGVGMALALAGVVMQAIVKNPLADPYVLGVSSGASLGATLAILVGVGSFLGSGYVGLVAFAGAFLVSMGVIALANIGGRATSVKLILAGTALSAICAAVSNFFLYVINTSSGALEAVVRWTMGSLAAASWDTNLWMLAVAVLGALFFLVPVPHS